jgi:Fe-Mn family superoxide dismutase
LYKRGAVVRVDATGRGDERERWWVRDVRPRSQRKEHAMPRYVLPDLAYDFGALEPHVSGKVMELHHGKHHAAYVKNANQTLDKLDEARSGEDFTRVAALEKSLAFNLSGHILHSIFWQNLAPKAGGRPDGELASALERDFGGFEKFARQMREVAGSIMGSGWAALVWEPLGQRLLITQIYDHQSNLSQSGVPLMVLDAWEHAYYLQYQDRKAEFFQAVWNLWNWKDVATRFESARKLNLRVARGAA